MRRADIDPARGAEAWVRRVVVNISLGYHRQARARGEVLTRFEEDEGFAAATRNPEESASDAELLDRLDEVLRRVGKERLDVFIEHVVFEMTAAEIARARGIPEETVRTRLKHVRAEIRAARARWEAEERGRGRGAVPILLVPVPLAAWVRRGLGMLRGFGAKLAAVVATAAIVAGIVILLFRYPMPVAPAVLTRMPAGALAPALVEELPDAIPAELTTAAASVAPADLVPAPVAPLLVTPPLVRPPPPVSPRARGPAPASTAVPLDDNPYERGLIGQARVALRAGDPALARRLLAVHERKFRRGRLAPEREALLQKIR